MYGTRLTVVATLLVAGCSSSDPPPGDTAGTSAEAPAAEVATDSAGVAATAGMDHSATAGMGHANMSGMAPAGAAVPEGAAMDHAAMRGTAMSATAAAANVVDHSATPGMATSGAPSAAHLIDHRAMPDLHGGVGSGPAAPPPAAGSGMARMRHGPAAETATPGDPPQGDTPSRAAPEMAHAGMPGMAGADPATATLAEAGTDKLRTLVAELVGDPAVRAAIQADTALSRRWADPGVQRVLRIP